MRSFVGFAGVGGVEIAMGAAGHNATSVELDADIARVNRENGGDVAIADMLQILSSALGYFWLMHFSPPCPNFSIAKVGGAETALDVAIGRKIAELITGNLPRFVTIENVWAYRKSQSWAIIQEGILSAGYTLDYWHLNAADYGVAQTRRRMIAIARRDGQRVQRPWPTHSKNGDMFTKKWVGWHETIEDLLPGLDDTELEPWQKKRLKGKGIKSNVLVSAQNGSFNRDGTRNLSCRQGLSPSLTVTASQNKHPFRAVLIPGDNTGNGTLRYDDEPMVTVTTRPPSRAPQTRTVLLSPRCLARFQSFPDSFTLPDEQTLACKGIGNALPPLLYSAILRSINSPRS